MSFVEVYCAQTTLHESLSPPFSVFASRSAVSAARLLVAELIRYLVRRERSLHSDFLF